jgi:hypothetical protein
MYPCSFPEENAYIGKTVKIFPLFPGSGGLTSHLPGWPVDAFLPFQGRLIIANMRTAFHFEKNPALTGQHCLLRKKGMMMLPFHPIKSVMSRFTADNS